MPYVIRRAGPGRYKVLNAATGRVVSKGTSLRKARSQVRLLRAKEKS